MFTRILSRVWYAFCVLCLIFGIFLAMQPNAQAQGASTPINPWVQHTEFDWYVLMFYHETGKVDEEGDPVRQLHGEWFTVLEGCEARIKALQAAKPDHITIDAILCFPIKKQPNQTR